ncbi:hypothetical protein HAX54_050380, partial [Datura stramonium]|nr:hypothetical protein [Datura stramonium]
MWFRGPLVPREGRRMRGKEGHGRGSGGETGRLDLGDATASWWSWSVVVPQTGQVGRGRGEGQPQLSCFCRGFSQGDPVLCWPGNGEKERGGTSPMVEMWFYLSYGGYRGLLVAREK